MVKAIASVGVGLMCASIVGAQQSPSAAGGPPGSPLPAGKLATPETLQAEIEVLRVPRVAWREIAWKSCLLEGLKESRAEKKPILLWVFIDRPADDERC